MNIKPTIKGVGERRSDREIRGEIEMWLRLWAAHWDNRLKHEAKGEQISADIERVAALQCQERVNALRWVQGRVVEWPTYDQVKQAIKEGA